MPHVAPAAWLHILYKGLNKAEIDDLEKGCPVKFPIDYKSFLTKFNGVNIFSDSLSIWGHRYSYERTGDNSYQPYDLLGLNRERPQGCSENWLFIGSYSWDGSRVIFDTSKGVKNSTVYRVGRRSTQILNEWNSFSDWILSEVVRLSKMFNGIGQRLSASTPTIP